MTRRALVLAVPPLDLAAVFRERLTRLLDGCALADADARNALLVLPEPMSGDGPEWDAFVRAVSAMIDTPPPGMRSRSVSVNPDLWPTRWPPLPLTVGQAIDLVKAAASTWPDELAAEVRRCVEELVQPELRAAVLARHRVPELWPWPKGDHPLTAWSLFRLVLEALAVETRVSSNWRPGEAAPLDVARWAGTKHAFMIECVASMGHLVDWKVNGARYPAAGVALLYLAELEVQREREKPRIAVDAGRPHNALVSGIRNLSKRLRSDEEVSVLELDNRIELLEPGRKGDPQLALPLGDEGLHGATVRALRAAMKWEGLRHWTAILRLLSVEGGRQGWTRWTMDGHLDALGYSARVRGDPTVLDRIARQVELLTMLELVLYDANGRERHRKPLLHVGDKYDRLEGSGWRLDGMELRINPHLYDGVRDPDTGKLGTNWFPAPIELARVDHVRHRHALALGLLLPMRWRWDLDKNRDHLPLAGHHLLDLAGITWREREPSHAWKVLKRDLEELRRIGLLARWTWDAGEPSRSGMCYLFPGEALMDRVVRGLLPVDPSPAEMPAALPINGAELRRWRKDKGWSQAELARRLGVSERTIRGGEAREGAQLHPRLREALRK